MAAERLQRRRDNEPTRRAKAVSCREVARCGETTAAQHAATARCTAMRGGNSDSAARRPRETARRSGARAAATMISAWRDDDNSAAR
ncbi:hypothetical protein Scep_028366 [Stephania cephalantha]|uniref:Uncharacterized protein n=1 Tax=Stephania cephalantha TaxID=152367 RepID=A0AAP0E9T6_9MAGN